MRLQILQHSSEDPVNARRVMKRAGVRLTSTGIFAFDSENHGQKSVAHPKAMAPHSSTLAWKIPWTEEPGRLQSLGSLRVGHD